MLPARSLPPLFPLPTVVSSPAVFLPLHIFEPRYKQMVTRALEGDRIIGMTLLKPGHEEAYEGRPPIFADRLRGLITHVERQNDGRLQPDPARPRASSASTSRSRRPTACSTASRT